MGSLASAMALLLSSSSQPSLRTRMEFFRWNYPISLLTLLLLLPNEARALGSCCATQRLGTASPLIWNLRRRTFGAKTTAFKSARAIPMASDSQQEHCDRT